MGPSCPRAAGTFPRSRGSSGPTPPLPGFQHRERLPADRAVDVAHRIRETLRVARSVDVELRSREQAGRCWLARSPRGSQRRAARSARCALRRSDVNSRRGSPPTMETRTAVPWFNDGYPWSRRPGHYVGASRATDAVSSSYRGGAAPTLRTAAALTAPRVGVQGNRHGSALRISTLFAPYRHSILQEYPAIIDFFDKIRPDIWFI